MERAHPRRAIPLTAVLGAIGTFAAWVSVVVLHVEARMVGTGWMVVGMIGYVIYRRRQGIDLTSHYKIEHRERPPFFDELDYRSALVPIFGTDVDASALRTAAKLVGEDAAVDAVYVLQVPNQLSLDAGLEEEEQLGRSVLESAKVAGRKAGLKVHTRLIRTRNPGHASGRRGAAAQRRDHLPGDRARAAVRAGARARPPPTCWPSAPAGSWSRSTAGKRASAATNGSALGRTPPPGGETRSMLLRHRPPRI